MSCAPVSVARAQAPRLRINRGLVHQPRPRRKRLVACIRCAGDRRAERFGVVGRRDLCDQPKRCSTASRLGEPHAGRSVKTRGTEGDEEARGSRLPASPSGASICSGRSSRASSGAGRFGRHQPGGRKPGSRAPRWRRRRNHLQRPPRSSASSSRPCSSSPRIRVDSRRRKLRSAGPQPRVGLELGNDPLEKAPDSPRDVGVGRNPPTAHPAKCAPSRASDSAMLLAPDPKCARGIARRPLRAEEFDRNDKTGVWSGSTERVGTELGEFEASITTLLRWRQRPPAIVRVEQGRAMISCRAIGHARSVRPTVERAASSAPISVEAAREAVDLRPLDMGLYPRSRSHARKSRARPRAGRHASDTRRADQLSS